MLSSTRAQVVIRFQVCIFDILNTAGEHVGRNQETL